MRPRRAKPAKPAAKKTAKQEPGASGAQVCLRAEAVTAQPPTPHADAAGLDIGAAEIWACVPADRDEFPVRCFGTFTPDLQALVAWLQQCQIRTVAMESTGVYWIPIYERLEAAGIEACLINARHLKNVPARNKSNKSDVQDCQWIQYLHGCGLLQASFRPAADFCALRAYVRHRAALIEHQAAHVQHMHKALQQMNVQLSQVLSDITGVTGLAIIRAIVAGQRDPVGLAQLRDKRCFSSAAEIAKALTGSYRPEHVFTLKQALALYDFYATQIAECDRQIEQHYSTMRPHFPSDSGDSGDSGHAGRPDPSDAAFATLPPLPPRAEKGHGKHAPPSSVREHLYRLTGVDLSAIKGLDLSILQTFLSETGIDMRRWPTDKHFCSWLGLAPHNDISGGKVLRSRTLPVDNRAGQVLRMAAESVARSDTALGAFYRRMRARLGPAQAIVATAHKIARLIYHLLKYREPYQETNAEEYAKVQQERQLQALQRKAARLGFQLTPKPA